MADEATTPEDNVTDEGQLSEDDMEAVVGGLGTSNMGILGEAGLGEAI
ncbi:MAG: hypothetical protein QG597_661 [Actinomycetota bacterium]|nr:hypothetical protein [Actinomycetota bacterium]